MANRAPVPYDQFKAAFAAKWQEIRRNDSIHLIDQLLANDGMLVLAQIAFETGREWAANHPGDPDRF